MTTTTIDNDRALLLRVASGDEAAFHTFYLRYWPQVYGTAFHLTRQAELAKDLSQDLFVKVWENRRKLADVREIESYIYTISRNLVFDFLKRKVFDQSHWEALIRTFPFEGQQASALAEYKELETVLHQAIQKLTGNVREVFILSRFEKLTHEQIAKKLHISVASSKTYAVRALQDIRKFLESQDNPAIIASLLVFWHLGK